MTTPDTILLFSLMALVTLAQRASFIVLGDRVTMPPLLRRALAYVPAAVLAAIVTPALFRESGVGVGPVDVRLLAGLVAALVAWRTKSIIATFATGMVALWTLTYLVG